jgi:hypothetical protein
VATGRSHWSNGARSAQFFVINAAACLPMLVLILHPTWSGLYVTLGTIAFLFWVEKVKKMTLSAFARSINIALTGRVKASLNLFKELAR